MSNQTATDLPKDSRTAAEPRRRRNLNPIIFIGLCAVVSLAPALLGAVQPIVWNTAGLCIAVLLLMNFIFPADEERIIGKYLLIPCLLFAVVVAIVLLQITPWVPDSWQNPVWRLASGALGRTLDGTISVDRQAALIGLFRLSTYAGIVYLSAILCREPSRAYAAVKVVSISGAIYATYGLAIYWSGNKAVLWYSKWAYGEDLTGPFVNRNSFATYLGLCTLAVLCYLIKSFEQLRLHGDLRHKIDLAIDFASRRVLILIMVFILTTALFLTHSRAGLGSTFVGILAIAFAMARSPSLKRLRRLGWIVLPLAMVFIALFISGGTIIDRLIGTDLATEERFSVYALIVQAIGNYPWLGTGLNSFISVFPIYRSSAVTHYFDLAHNDYLQNLLELGIPGALCLFASVMWLAVICWRGLRLRRRDAVFPCLGIAATVLVALHSTLDFSLQIPAVTYTYCFLLGAAVAQSWTSRRDAFQSVGEKSPVRSQKLLTTRQVRTPRQS